MDFSSIQNLVNQFNELQIGAQEAIIRKQGFLEKQIMPWQNNRETLFQFKEIYKDRLESIRQSFSAKACTTIQNISSDIGQCELIGLLKRIQQKRVRAFEPQFKDKYDNHQPLYSKGDILELQDQTGKVKLQIKHFSTLNKEKFSQMQIPYGVILRCKGKYDPRINRFIVYNAQIPKAATQQRIKLPDGNQKYMILMSEPSTQDMRRMLDFLRNISDKKSTFSCQLIIIGGLDLKDLNQIRQFDNLLYELGQRIDTFFIPSTNEQTNFMFPLRATSKCLLQKAYSSQNVGNCSNPQLIKSNSSNIKLNTLVSCGSNIENLKVNCYSEGQIALMKMIISHRHICPSSAFSLPIQSYNYDPLVLKQTPHIMICGKANSFKTQYSSIQSSTGKYINVRLIALAKGDIATINICSKILETQKIEL